MVIPESLKVDSSVLDVLEVDAETFIPDVDDRDEMYIFLTTHEASKAHPLNSYYLTGKDASNIVLKILADAGIDHRSIRNLLEFGCGYGRVTRFLLQTFKPAVLTVSDINRDAVDFQCNTFQVEGIYSVSEADAFQMEETFEAIFVASVFTHLPIESWSKWLRRLIELLSDDGILIFSVNLINRWRHVLQRVATGFRRPSELLRPQSGFSFQEISESLTLPPQDYGTTFVTKKYVKQQLAQNPGVKLQMHYPQLLYNCQDTFVVRKQ